VRAVHGQKSSYRFRLIYLIGAACRMGWRFARCVAEKTFIWPASRMGRGPPFSAAWRPFGAIYGEAVPGLNCHGAKLFCLSAKVAGLTPCVVRRRKLPWGGQACSDNRAAACRRAGRCAPRTTKGGKTDVLPRLHASAALRSGKTT